MSKRSAVLRCVAAAVFAALAASVLMVSAASADDAAPAQTLQGKKPQAKPAATAPAAKPAPPKATKAAKPPKPPKPPEKSMEEQRAIDGLWAKRTNWLSVRAGYAKATGDFAGDAFGGYGIAYQRMLTSKYSFGGAVQHDVVGRLGSSSEISVPFTLELARHFHWKTAMRPYVGFGGGYYFHKYYRTAGGDSGSPGFGTYINFGTNLPVSPRHLLGLDSRVSFVSTTEHATNPVFGEQKSSETLWSVKVNWAFGY